MDSRAERSDPAKETESDFAQFTDFVRRIVSVPHSEIQRRLEEEKRSKTYASPGPASGKTTQ